MPEADERGEENYYTVNKSVFMVQIDTPVLNGEYVRLQYSLTTSNANESRERTFYRLILLSVLNHLYTYCPNNLIS